MSMLGNVNYNGWQNRETWCVNLHMDTTFYDYALELIEQTDVHELVENEDGASLVKVLALRLESLCDEILDYDNMNALARDLMAYDRVNFAEIAQAHLESAIESTIIDNTNTQNGVPNETAAAWMIVLNDIKNIYS